MHKLSYKFRLYPTKGQKTLLEKTLELCRWTYNKTIEVRRDSWEKEKKSISKYETYNLLPLWKVDKPDLNDVYSQALQQVQERVDLAYRAFFRRVKNGEEPGYPRFKGEGQYKSITFPQYGNGISLKPKGLQVSKIGLIKLKLHRDISLSATIKRVTIKRENDLWFVVLSLEDSSFTNSCGKGIVGIDLGCKTFATLSNEEVIESPKFLSKAEKRLAKIQRKIDRFEKGSPEQAKPRKTLAKIHKKVGNQRHDFLHQESRKLVNTYETLVFEKLDVENMIAKAPWPTLTKAIHDSGWSDFIFMCSYKAENAGGKVILVDPRNTSKTCSRCGAIVDKSLSERTHRCHSCGLIMNRDLNASLNILRLGQKSLAKTA